MVDLRAGLKVGDMGANPLADVDGHAAPPRDVANRNPLAVMGALW